MTLKDCPFCGTPKENGYLNLSNDGAYVLCMSCRASAPIGIWNLRAPWLIENVEQHAKLAAHRFRSTVIGLSDESTSKLINIITEAMETK